MRKPLTFSALRYPSQPKTTAHPHHLLGMELHKALIQKNDLLSLELIKNNEVHDYKYLFDAARNNCVESLKYLISTINPPKETIDNLLLSACETNAVQSVQYLLSLDANPNHLNDQGHNALYAIAYNGCTEALQEIFNHYDGRLGELDLNRLHGHDTLFHLAFKTQSQKFHLQIKDITSDDEEQLR